MKHIKFFLLIIIVVTGINAMAQKKADYPSEQLLKFNLSQVIRHVNDGFANWRANETSTAAGKQYTTWFKITTGDEPRLFLQNGSWFYTDLLLSEANQNYADGVQQDWKKMIAEANPEWAVATQKKYNNISVIRFTSSDENTVAISLIIYPNKNVWNVSLVAQHAGISDETVITLLAPGEKTSAGN